MNFDGPPLELFLRNFFGQATAFLVILSVVFLVVWRWGARRFQGARIHTKRRADAKQIRGEVANTLVTLAIGAANGTAVALLYKAGHTKLTDDASQWGTLAVALSAVGLVVFNDAWFYGWHRLLHHPRLFKHVHAVHHRSVDVNPFTSYSFHAVEAFIVGGWAVPMVLVVPLYLPVFGVVQVIGTANNVMSHLGYEFLPRWILKVPGLRWMNSATFHSLHHTQFNGNYGLFFRFWDRLLGTEVAGYEQAFLSRGRNVPSGGQPMTGLRVTEVVRESPSTTSLVVEPVGPAPRLEPGQFVQVRWNGEARCYSFSHPDRLRLTIKRVPGGRVSGPLVDGVSVGHVLDVRGPFGSFGSALPVTGRVLFVAGGSGVTPFGSLGPAAVRRGLATRLVVVNRNKDDAPLVQELQAVPGLDVHAHFDGDAGILDETALAALLGPRPDGVWSCGPEPLMALVRRTVERTWPGLPVVEERFVAHADRVDAPARVTVVTAGLRQLVTVPAGSSILEAARATGVSMPAGCEQGACGTCRVQVLEGRVETPAASCLSAEERRQGLALACVGRAGDGAVIEPVEKV